MKTTQFDAAEYLEDDETMAAYLEACLEEGGEELFLSALKDVARAKGMAKIAEEAGLGRESLYKALSPGAHPRFETIRRVVNALGLKIALTA